jgi:hypothetical protein
MKKTLIAIFIAALIPSLCMAGPVQNAQRRVILAKNGATDVTAPTLTSITIGTNGTSWTFAYSENVTGSPTSDLCGAYTAAMTTAGAITLTYASGDGTSSVVCTGSPTVNSGDTVANGGVDYTQPGNGIEDTAGNDLASLTDKAVTNNSTQGGGFTDAFAALTSWTQDTTDNFNFTIASNQLSAQGADYSEGRMKYNTPTSTINQYQRIQRVRIANAVVFFGFMWRLSSDWSGYSYNTTWSNGTVYASELTNAAWVRDIASASMALSEGEYFCSMIRLTADNARFFVWRNCTNATPLSAGTGCTNTALPCWDNVTDTPDVNLNAAINNEQDTNKYLGVVVDMGSNGSEEVLLDNWSGGDVPN